MKEIWLLYDDPDYALNRDFAVSMHRNGLRHGWDIQPVCLSELTMGMDGSGDPFCLRKGVPVRPWAVLSRQRSALVSRHLEQMGVPVFNNSQVCAICNDKRATHQFLQGLPMPETVFLQDGQRAPESGYPCILKPACSHGGDRVALVHTPSAWDAAAKAIFPESAVQQQVVSDAGRDLRVYVVGGRLYAGVMRRARQGVVSNFKLGGQAELHSLTEEETALAQEVVSRFQQANAPLWLSGVDLLYHNGHPVVGEVEDVVGSRMLYQCRHRDILADYLSALHDHME